MEELNSSVEKKTQEAGEMAGGVLLQRAHDQYKKIEILCISEHKKYKRNMDYLLKEMN